MWLNPQKVKETDPETLSKLTNQEVKEQLHIHEKLYSEFRDWVDTKQKHNEDLDEDVEYAFLVLENEYWDIKAEYKRRFCNKHNVSLEK